MSKEIVNQSKAEIAEKAAGPDKQLAAPVVPRPGGPLFFNPFLNAGFFSFRYSYGEMSSSDGKTQIRAHQYRYENGKFSSEEFEGTTDHTVYDQAVQNFQHLVADSMNFFFQPFASILPRTSNPKEKD
ncbi:MAG: hypothetical protein ACU843_00995 [Gammaproteobacteria bacterium]